MAQEFTVFENSAQEFAYTGNASDTLSVTELAGSSLQEQHTDSRVTRSMNSVFKYDFKVGNYLPDDAKKLNPHLFMTMKDITTGIRKSS